MSVICAGFLIVMWCEEPKTPPPVVVCPQVTEWSPQFQRDLADDIEMRQGARIEQPLVRAAQELIRLRAQLRKCRKARTAK